MTTPPEHSDASTDPQDAADNTGIGETGSFPGEGGDEKALETVQDDDRLARHVDGDGHERTGTPGPAAGSA